MTERMRIAGTCVVTASLTLLMAGPPTRAAGGGPWLSPNRYRTILTVDARGVARSHSPVSVQIDFTQLLAAAGETGTFDPDTVEVIAYDAADAPVVFDAVRNGYDRYLLPWRVERAWPISRVTFSFVMPDHNCTRYELYYDTVESGLGKPQRYPGIVGNGDKFTDGHARREVNACGYDTFCDFDGDGDQDLFKGGTEPYIYVYENVGGNRFVDRGRLTSGGAVLPFPMDGNNRSWLSCEFCDWDRDGDQDLFVHSPTGPDVSYINQVMKYENITAPGAPLTFEYRGLLKTVSGQTLGSAVSFVDWDGDGKTDVMGGRDGLVTFYRNIGSSGSVSNMQIADGVYIRANGVEIQVMSPRTDAKDIDGDGDLDLFVGSEEGRVFFFENVGTRTQPVFTMGRLIAFHEYMDARTGVRVADFDGDGLLDFVPGRYWERTQWGEQPRVYGRLYKNVGTTTAPRFEARDAFNGSPYTERFQNVDAVRQNGVRVVDWDNDGRPDLIASDTDGFVWWFRNTTNRLFPIFAPGVKLMAGGEILRVYGEEDYNRAAGYARCDVCDWNNDGKKDLLVADGRAWLWLYLNENTDASPVLGPGTRVMANGKPIDGTARGSVLVCDWNNDGKKDVIFGMVNNGHPLASQYYDWDHQSADPSTDEGFLFYKNTGSDAAPVLAYPKWLRAGPGGGTIIKYTRPNLGSYVDWDGDGKKDFIGCEFENNARFYKNTGSGAPNTEPAFTSSASGVRIVQPFTVQMMSGADAVDFNGDGDLDIVTGQGHGGSGIRFYERDYINDYVNETVSGTNTWPSVTVGATERKLVRADFDGDNDVDQADFGHLQECFSESGMPYLQGCADADFDGDGDVDLKDFTAFITCMNGPDTASNCAWM